jgi:hypothetical protein
MSEQDRFGAMEEDWLDPDHSNDSYFCDYDDCDDYKKEDA